MTINFANWVAICERKARYCRTLDTKDWAGYADCFTEDVVFDLPPGMIIEGRDASVMDVRGHVETAVTAHHVHNPEIAFAPDGQSAEVIWAMQDRVSWGKAASPRSAIRGIRATATIASATSNARMASGGSSGWP